MDGTQDNFIYNKKDNSMGNHTGSGSSTENDNENSDNDVNPVNDILSDDE